VKQSHGVTSFNVAFNLSGSDLGVDFTGAGELMGCCEGIWSGGAESGPLATRGSISVDGRRFWCAIDAWWEISSSEVLGSMTVMEGGKVWNARCEMSNEEKGECVDRDKVGANV